MMGVNASLGDALDLALLDRTDLAKETAKDGSKRRRRSVRLSQGASPAGTQSASASPSCRSAGCTAPTGRGARPYTGCSTSSCGARRRLTSSPARRTTTSLSSPGFC